MKTKNNIISKIGIAVTAIIGIYVLFCFLSCFPLPRGSKVDNRYYTYYKNVRGIYYISVENSFALINNGNWDYLNDVDESTFTVLDNGWAKDANHVWQGKDIAPNVDVSTFQINASGVPVDKNNVYVYDSKAGLKPFPREIDVETAEYFVPGNRAWIRDKNNVFYYNKKIDVDRATFKILKKDWFIDKDFLYGTVYNNKTREWELHCIDSLQSPIKAGYQYLRNGRNIIYCNSVIIRDIDVRRFEEIGASKYRVNDMLFLNGVPFLKDSLDVKNARFYFYGHIAADNNGVYFGHNLLDDINAPTFHQRDANTFEDKYFIYTLKENVWREEYPFDKKAK